MNACRAWITRPLSGWHLALPFLYMSGILGLSTLPGHVLEFEDASDLLVVATPQLQNFLHIPMYGLLAVLWCKFFAHFRLTVRSNVLVACLITTSFGVFDEWYQSFIVGRYSTIIDAILNAVGALSFCVLYTHILW